MKHKILFIFTNIETGQVQMKALPMEDWNMITTMAADDLAT